jgi:mannitol-specific phosphotransferase system IIBC component
LPCFSIIKGYAKQDFRAALGVIRVGEAVFTGIDYYFSADSMEIIPYIVPSVLLGIPLGSYLIRWMDPETFRRICMAFDALVVAFGLSRVLIELNLATAFTTYSILTIMMMLNAYLLFRFFRDRAVPKGRREGIPA